MDWNWFFSTLSQSAAALIGIIGAYVISRLLAINSEINALGSELDDLLIDYNGIILKINRIRFDWYTTFLVKNNTKLKKMINKGDFEDLTEDKVIEKIYEIDDSIFKIDDAVLTAYNELRVNYKPFKALIIFDAINNNQINELLNERERFENLQIASYILIEKFKKNSQHLNYFDNALKAMKIIIYTLLFAFFLLVIYPLHFMPMSENQDPEISFKLKQIIISIYSLKGGLLIMFFSIIGGLFLYFLYLTKLIKRILNYENERNSDYYKNIKNYSVHFK